MTLPEGSAAVTTTTFTSYLLKPTQESNSGRRKTRLGYDPVDVCMALAAQMGRVDVLNRMAKHWGNSQRITRKTRS